MKIFFSVGEPSGDLHGANLIRELRQRDGGLECVGYGGPKMAAAGCQLHADLTQLAVMWLWHVLLNLHRFWILYRRAARYFREQRPDAVVLIDFPGFNWWIARAAKRSGIPVFYYGAPQLWAWAGWRVRKMRRLVDHVLCKLPFEADWYRQRGCRATFIGHPYFDQMHRQTLDAEFIAGMTDPRRPLLTLLPGSRTQEVKLNLRWLLKAADRVRQTLPETRLAIASFNEKQAEMARREVAESGVAAEVFVGRTQELIHASRCCLACSGSVSLELLHHTKPTVIHYRANRLGIALARRWVMRVRSITLVNLLASDQPLLAGGERYDPRQASDLATLFPEFLTSEDRSAEMAEHLIRWLSDDAAHRERVAELERLRQRIGRPGASATAADYILQELRSGKREVPRPHFDRKKLRQKGKIEAR